MTARSAAAAGRRFAAEQMIDTCTITRAGAPSFNSTTGVITPGAPTTVYSGQCRLRTPTAQESELLFGEEQVTATRYILDTPHTTTGVRIDDIVTLTASEDPEALARTLRVATRTAETIYVMKSYGCESVE